MSELLLALGFFVGVVGTMVGAFALMIYIVDKSDERSDK